MNHNYKITDFKRILEEPDIDINERIISVDLSNVREIPTIIIKRVETIINKKIADYEQENNTTIIAESSELGISIEIDTKEQELSLSIYVGYDPFKECITGKEVLYVTDGDYSLIKKFFFKELNHRLFGKVSKLYSCID